MTPEEIEILNRDSVNDGDLANANAISNRIQAYPRIEEQLDMQFHDSVNGTTTWKDAIQAIKDANPKS